MSLEAIIKPLKWLDTKVQKQYTRLGAHIVDEKLYKFTLGAQLIGKIGTATWGTTLFNMHPVPSGFLSGLIFDSPDFMLNLSGLSGRLTKNQEGDALAIDPVDNACMSYNKTARLPIFLTSAAFLGAAVYEVADYAMNSNPISSNTGFYVLHGMGFLSLASSMYLKDQDPKLLNKQPSKTKALLKQAYEKAAEMITPSPVPQPIPVRHYCRYQ